VKDILAWFGLKRQPFPKEIKTTDLVETAPIKEAAARLDYMKRRGGIMLLNGDPGVGKTVTLRRFVDQLNPNLYRPVYTPLTTLKGSDLLRHLNQMLGLPSRPTKSAVYRQLQLEILDSREQRGRTVILIIDEAQLLQVAPLQELRLLTNFKMDSFDPFILILAGQSDLKRTMDYAIMEPLSQRIAMRYHMAGLGPEETADYVKLQLELANAPKEIFGADALKAIHDVTFGIPRRIGAVALQALTYAMFADKRRVDADTVMAVKKGG